MEVKDRTKFVLLPLHRAKDKTMYKYLKRTLGQTVSDSQLQLVLSSSDERVRVRILNNHSLKGQTLDKEEPCLLLA